MYVDSDFVGPATPLLKQHLESLFVKYKVDVNTLHKIEGDLSVGLNDIARISMRTSAPLFVDSYSRNRTTGSLVLIDEQTNATVAAGMLI